MFVRTAGEVAQLSLTEKWTGLAAWATANIQEVIMAGVCSDKTERRTFTEVRRYRCLSTIRLESEGKR